MYDNHDSPYHVMTANVIPTQKEKTPEGRLEYRLWIETLHFRNVKKVQIKVVTILGPSLFELEEFLSNQRISVQSKNICNIASCLLAT